MKASFHPESTTLHLLVGSSMRKVQSMCLILNIVILLYIWGFYVIVQYNKRQYARYHEYVSAFFLSYIEGD